MLPQIPEQLSSTVGRTTQEVGAWTGRQIQRGIGGLERGIKFVKQISQSVDSPRSTEQPDADIGAKNKAMWVDLKIG